LRANSRTIAKLSVANDFVTNAQAFDRQVRRWMIEKNHPSLSVGMPCRLLSISRSSFDFEPQGETAMPVDHAADRPAVSANGAVPVTVLPPLLIALQKDLNRSNLRETDLPIRHSSGHRLTILAHLRLGLAAS
jgi:putative transposase